MGRGGTQQNKNKQTLGINEIRTVGMRQKEVNVKINSNSGISIFVKVGC